MRERTEVTRAEAELIVRRDVSTDARVVSVLLGIGLATVYQAVKTGDLPSVRVGGRVVIPCVPLREMLSLEPLEARELAS